MKLDEEACFARGETENGGAGGCEALLHAEVSFWRDLLGDCDGTLPPESIERMRQALALAEYRCLQLGGSCPPDPASSDGPARTSRPGQGFLH